MKYYKKIEIDQYDRVIEQCRNYIKTIDHIYNRSYNASYYPLEFDDFVNSCPLIKICFQKYDLTCTFAAAYVSYSNSNNPIHVDNFYHKARINLPLINCEYSTTLYYTGGVFNLSPNGETKTSPSLLQSSASLRLADKVVVDTATVILVNEPHKVLMDQQKSPRISLTLGFDKDPIFLLND